MRFKLFVIGITFSFSCSKNVDEKISNDLKIIDSSVTENKDHFNWIGTINKNIPVFIHYKTVDKLIVGELTYLNTKNKRPIKIIGAKEEDKSFRILEFDSTGNITGVIIGSPSGNNFNGSWTSPKTDKEFELTLVSKDTSLPEIDIVPNDIFGSYSYRYDEDGYQGDFEIKALDNSKEVEFGISSVTSSPSRNIAQVETDTISITGNSFIYSIPESEDCEFKVTFYKDFIFIEYTKGFCDSQFGMNATIDGIFFKTR